MTTLSTKISTNELSHLSVSGKFYGQSYGTSVPVRK